VNQKSGDKRYEECLKQIEKETWSPLPKESKIGLFRWRSVITGEQRDGLPSVDERGKYMTKNNPPPVTTTSEIRQKRSFNLKPRTSHGAEKRLRFTLGSY